MPQIEVTFDIDANGIVNVSAKDLGTGREQHITITAGSNMSDDEIERAVKEAAQYEAEDKKRKEGIDARNDADSTVFQIENALNEVGDKVSDADKSSVQAEIDSLKAVLDRTKDMDSLTDADIDALKSGKERLMNAAQPVFTKMYEAQNPNMGGAQGGPQGGFNGQAGPQGGQQDDVVDGDYTEV